MHTPKSRMLARAADTLGGYKTLADRLGVAAEVLTDWISGKVDPPETAYFAAMDIVSRGPFNKSSDPS